MKRRAHTTWLFIFVAVLLINFNAAQEPGAQELGNVGLIHIPVSLKTKFPVCEKQLIVTWINRERLQGHTQFDAYWLPNEKYVDRFKSFVNLEGFPYTYKLVAYYPKNQNDGKQGLIQSRHKGDRSYPYFPDKQRLVNDNFDELLELVATAGISRGLYSSDQSDTIQQMDEGIPYLTLSADRHFICVVAPNEDWAWIVERKAMKHSSNSEQIDAVYDRVKKLFHPVLLRDNPKAHREIFDFASAYDLNSDGIDDYFFDYMAIYSVKKRDGTIGYQDRNFSDCQVRFSAMGSQMTTRGQDFFYMGCNISALAK